MTDHFTIRDTLQLKRITRMTLGVAHSRGMTLRAPVVYDHDRHQHLLPSFVDIHIDCIKTDQTTATFRPPLKPEKMLAWWHSRGEETAAGHRSIIMLLADSGTDADELAGYVMLEKPVTETGPFRGNVEKLLVSPNHRRKGVGRGLMMKLEEEARKEGRTLLVSRGKYWKSHVTLTISLNRCWAPKQAAPQIQCILSWDTIRSVHVLKLSFAF